MPADIAYTTSHLPAERRVAGWTEAAADRFVESSFKVANPEAFDASMLVRDMADVSLTRILSAGHDTKRITRSGKQAACAAEEFFLVSLQLEGTCAIEQHGRQAMLRPGEFAIYDTRLPYELMLREDYRQVVMRIPRRTLTARLPHSDALVAMRVDADELPSRMLTQMVHAACATHSPLGPAASSDLADGLLGVLCAGLRSLGDGMSPANGRERQHARVAEHIARHLADPTLGVASIAQALGLSVSYLHKLYRGQAQTLERSIWSQRLDACERALRDPRSAGRTITDIAYAFGFNDAAHFSRSFQRRFGATPSAYRKRASAVGSRAA